MSSAQAQLEEAKDEGQKQLGTVQAQLGLGAQALVQMAKFGPVLAFQINMRSMMALPWGLVSAGAAGTAAGVDGGDSTGVANLTAIMVKMGLLDLVHDIVVKLAALDRADVTAAVTLGLLELKEISIVMQINNALIKSGHMSEGAEISKEMLKNGQMQFMDLLKQAGGEWLGGDDKDTEKDKDSSKKKENSWFGSSDQQKDGPKKVEGEEKSSRQHIASDSGTTTQPSSVNAVADRVAASINSAAEAVMPVKPQSKNQSQATSSSQPSSSNASGSHKDARTI